MSYFHYCIIKLLEMFFFCFGYLTCGNFPWNNCLANLSSPIPVKCHAHLIWLQMKSFLILDVLAQLKNNGIKHKGLSLDVQELSKTIWMEYLQSFNVMVVGGLNLKAAWYWWFCFYMTRLVLVFKRYYSLSQSLDLYLSSHFWRVCCQGRWMNVSTASNHMPCMMIPDSV